MQGLRVMSRGERLGLATLSSVAGVKEEASAMACGFALGPASMPVAASHRPIWV